MIQHGLLVKGASSGASWQSSQTDMFYSLRWLDFEALKSTLSAFKPFPRSPTNFLGKNLCLPKLFWVARRKFGWMLFPSSWMRNLLKPIWAQNLNLVDKNMGNIIVLARIEKAFTWHLPPDNGDNLHVITGEKGLQCGPSWEINIAGNFQSKLIFYEIAGTLAGTNEKIKQLQPGSSAFLTGLSIILCGKISTLWQKRIQ